MFYQFYHKRDKIMNWHNSQFYHKRDKIMIPSFFTEFGFLHSSQNSVQTEISINKNIFSFRHFKNSMLL